MELRQVSCWVVLAAAISVSLPGVAAANPLNVDCPASLANGIPVRADKALTGSAFAHKVQGLSGEQRDAVTGSLLLSGDIPSFLRHLRPIRLEGHRAGGIVVTVTICVTPDYLAVGSDDDFVRVPMGFPLAATVADTFGFVLPTTRVVDAIYAQADLRLAPRPLQPGPQMRSTAYFVFHDDLIGQEMMTEGAAPGLLVAGQKKDLVITNRLRTTPGRVAIYGWHREIGKPIQPLSAVHGKNYSDYSHGVRLVSRIVYVDGEEQSVLSVLGDPQLASILSNEGPIPSGLDVDGKSSWGKTNSTIREPSERPPVVNAQAH